MNPCKTCKFHQQLTCCNGCDIPDEEWEGSCTHYSKDEQTQLGVEKE